MTDNYTPGIQNHNQEEKLLCASSNEASAPIPQNGQPNYYPAQNYYPNSLTVNPGYSSDTINTNEQSYYKNDMNNTNTNVNNNYIHNEPEVSKSLLCMQYTYSIMLYIYVIFDIKLQINFEYVNLFSMADDLAIIIIASIFLICAYKKKSARNMFFGFFTGLVWSFGFISKIYALGFVKSGGHDAQYVQIFLIIIRTILVCFSAPLICKT